MDVALGSLSADMPDKGCKLEVVFKSDNTVKLDNGFSVVCASPYCYCQHRCHLKNGGFRGCMVLVLIAQMKTVIFEHGEKCAQYLGICLFCDGLSPVLFGWFWWCLDGGYSAVSAGTR